jgi:MFS family permease
MGNQIEEKVQMLPPEKIVPYAWVALFVAYISSVVSSYVFLAVSPLLPFIIGRYHVGLASSGLTMAIFSFVGLALSVPIGAALAKLGIKVIGIMAMTFMTGGCLLGAVATNYPVFLLSRGLEGFGFTCIALVGMTTAGLWFPRKKVSLAMGIASTCVGVGGFFTMTTTGWVVRTMGPQAVWWIGSVAAAMSLVLVILFVRMPPWISKINKRPSLKEGYGNRNIWLLTVAFCCLYLPSMSLTHFYVHYLTKARGFTIGQAGWANSFSMLGLLVGAPLAGIVINKVGHLRNCLIVVGFCIIALVIAAFNVTGIYIPIYTALVGLVAMAGAQVISLTLIPRIMIKPELIGVGIGIYMLGANLSVIIGPPLVGAAVDKFGWTGGAYSMIPIVAFGIVITAMLRIKEE